MAPLTASLIPSSIVLRRDAGQLPVARAWVMEHACDAGLAPNDLFAVELGLSEGFAGVLRDTRDDEHAVDEIALELRVDDERVVLEIHEYSEPFAKLLRVVHLRSSGGRS